LTRWGGGGKRKKFSVFGGEGGRGECAYPFLSLAPRRERGKKKGGKKGIPKTSEAVSPSPPRGGGKEGGKKRGGANRRSLLLTALISLKKKKGKEKKNR